MSPEPRTRNEVGLAEDRHEKIKIISRADDKVVAMNLLATVADANFVRAAKQLFASVYFNAGWRGDYMLLSAGIPESEQKWFKDRGIIVREVDPIISEGEWENRVPEIAIEGTSKYSVATMAKIHLLRSDFKKWRTVLYLDSDIIVRGPLSYLSRVNQFSAVKDYGKTILKQFVSPKHVPEVQPEIDKLATKLSLESPSFNAGVFAFPTSVIEPESFTQLVSLARNNLRSARYGDQLAWNIFFYGRWADLPRTYNYFVYYLTEMGKTVKENRFYGAVLHFPGLDQRPWLPQNKFYEEWSANLNRAEEMHVSRRFRRPVIKTLKRVCHVKWSIIRHRLQGA